MKPLRPNEPHPGFVDPAASAIRRPPVLALIAISALSPFAINSVVPSLPAIGTDFNASYSRVQLIVSLFLASVAVAQIFIGPLSDRFGRRPVLLCGFVVFILASATAPFAPSVDALIGIRIVQGASGCVGIVLGRAIVRDLFEGRQAASMLGYVTMGLAMAPMVAPGIGGALQDFVGWTAIFWFMAVSGALCLAVTFAYVPETNLHRAASMSFGSLFGNFSRLLRTPDFVLFTLSASLTSGVFFAFLGGVPYVAERLLGLTPSEYGVWFGTVAIGYAGGSFLTGRFTERFGISRMILAGSILGLTTAIAAPALLFAGYAGAPALFLPMVAVGLANGIALPSAISGAIGVRPEIAGAASGLAGAAQIGAGALLSAAAGAALTGGTTALPMFALMAAAAFLSLLCAIVIHRRTTRP